MNTMKPMTNLLAVGVLMSAAACASVVTITLDNPNQTGSPGEMLSFFGTIANTGSGPVFLNQNSLNFGLSDAAVSDNFVALYFPVSLAGNASSGDIDLFDITLANPETQPIGLYAGSYGLIGGVDGAAQDNLAQVNFSVVATPETAPLALLLAGLGAIAIRRRSQAAVSGFQSRP